MFGRKISFKEKAKKAYDDFLEESKEGIAEKRLYFSTGHDAMDYDVNLERFEKEYEYKLQALGGNNLVSYYIFRKKEE